MTVIGIHKAVEAIKRAGWDQVRDTNNEVFLVDDIDATDEGDTTEYVIDADSVEQLRHGFRELIWTREGDVS